MNDDEFPSGIFQRRIVWVLDPSGVRCLALEEDMSLMRLEAIDSDKKVTVASIRDNDKFQALDRVLDITRFAIVGTSQLPESARGVLLEPFIPS